VDVDLRLVRYFTVVAAHGNFRRAAAALHVAQPSLSRQIQQLEKLLGVRLFERTRQGSDLTAAGEAFLAEAHELLQVAERAVNQARAADASGALEIGYTGNLLVTPAVRQLRRHGHQARTRHLPQSDVASALLDGRVDVAVTRLPLSAAGLCLAVLYEHPRVLVVPTWHRLAGKESVRLDDFADELLVRHPDPQMDAFWRIDPRPDGRPAPAGPIADTVEDKLELVAAGEALTLAPAGYLAMPRPDLTFVPVDGLAPCVVVAASRARDARPAVEHFLAIATALLHAA